MSAQALYNDIWIARYCRGTVDACSVVRANTPDGFFTHPAISPNGRHVAFWGECGDTVDVWIADSSGQHAENLTRGDGLNGHPAWSPDSNKIAFFHSSTAKVGSYSPPYGDAVAAKFANRDIWVIDIETRVWTQVTNDEFDNERPAWSPGGERIAYVSGRSGQRNLWSVAQDGGAMRQITKSPGIHYRPAWHPHGKVLAFNNKGTGSHYLWVVDAEGNEEPKQLTPIGRTGVVHDHGPCWSADGKEVLFHSDRGGKYNLWIIGADGGEPRPVLVPGFPKAAHATWNQNGDIMSFDAPRILDLTGPTSGPEAEERIPA